MSEESEKKTLTEETSQISFASEVTPIMGSDKRKVIEKEPLVETAPVDEYDESNVDVPMQETDVYSYLKRRETFSSVVIVSLLLVIIALAGENASNSNQTANLVEDKISVLKIQWRPCQMYLGDGAKVIQTSLGDPGTHWGQIACLVRKDDDADEPIEYGMPSADILVDFDDIAHPDREPIMGFGGAFTEASALNFMTLSEEGREAVMSLLFGKEGLGYSLGRVHMNSCDFSVKSYNFDDVDGDFNLTNFDTGVTHDVTSGMIHMMVLANQKLQNDWKEGMNIMASPWSPPAWMKKPTWHDPIGAVHAEGMTGSAMPNCLREGTGPDSRYAASWALYFSKFLTACKFGIR